MEDPELSVEIPGPVPEYDLAAVFVYGRLKGVTRYTLAHILADRHGRPTRNHREATLVVVGHAAALKCLSGTTNELTLPFSSQSGLTISEGAFLRHLGLAPASTASTPGPYVVDDVSRTAGLSFEVCRSLVLLDILRPVGERFAYQDLATGRQVAGLLTAGIPLAGIAAAAAELTGRGLRLSQARLVKAPWGGVAQRIDGQIARLDGQFALVLGEETVDAEQCFAEAEDREQTGDLVGAERWYARAEKLDRHDPVLPFNRGNVLLAAGRHKEALMAFRQALARDADFVEAAFNMARLYEEAKESELALRLYQTALDALPTYSQAQFNRARLLTALERYGEALQLWDLFIKDAPDDPDIGHARRMALLCRMEVKSEQPHLPTRINARLPGEAR